MRQPAERFREQRAQKAVDHLNNGSILDDILVIVLSSRFWVLIAVILGTIAVLTQ